MRLPLSNIDHGHSASNTVTNLSRLPFSDTSMDIDTGYGRLLAGDAAISCFEPIILVDPTRAPIAGIGLQERHDSS